jgi:UDP-3-O-[3-hydroxymyristoyl] glucosamine N-acyltransferase
MRVAPRTVARIARKLGGIVVGPEEALVDHIAGIEAAGPGALTFLSNRRYAPFLATTGATAVLVHADIAPINGGPCLIRVPDPYAAFAQALAWMYPPVPPLRGYTRAPWSPMMRSSMAHSSMHWPWWEPAQ